MGQGRHLRRVSLIGIAIVALALIPAASGSAASRQIAAPVVQSLVAQPSRLPAQGGSVHLVANVARSMTCTFGGGEKTVALKCDTGVSAANIAVAPNSSVQSRVDRLWVLARGKGGVRRRFVAVFQAGRQVSPPTTTTTLPPKAATVCSGPCKFVFPQATPPGVISVAMNSVSQGVSCSDPGLCTATTSQQIDDVNVTVCAGTSGIIDAAGQIYNFSLALSNGAQASTDSVTFDGSVPSALGNDGAVAPNQCVTGDIYLDAPIGVSWVSLNYSYTSADFSTQTVYAWKA